MDKERKMNSSITQMIRTKNHGLKVTIILPTYNRAELLERCVNSVINQTYSNWRLIISDDASTDGTQEIVKYLKLIDNRILYNRNEKNLGLPKNRNKGVSLASCSLILFIEDDIILEPNCLEILVETWKNLEQRKIKVGAICPALISEFSYSNSQRNFLSFARKLKEKNLEKNPCFIDEKTGLIYRNFSPSFKSILEVEDCHACSLYTKDIFRKIRYEESAYKGNYAGEETEFHLKLRKMGYKLFFQPKSIMYHKIVSSGGCRLPLYKWSYYFMRNHITYLIRNFGIKSFNMMQNFLMFTIYVFMIRLSNNLFGEQ